MPMKRYKPEQIVTLLRQIEVEMANGKTTPQACKEAEITVQTFYRWRKEFGGLKLYQAKRLKELVRQRYNNLVAMHALLKLCDPGTQRVFAAVTGLHAGTCPVDQQTP